VNVDKLKAMPDFGGREGTGRRGRLSPFPGRVLGREPRQRRREEGQIAVSIDCISERHFSRDKVLLFSADIGCALEVESLNH
jgi:hypothetical protein